jgi:hypothetical protein
MSLAADDLDDVGCWSVHLTPRELARCQAESLIVTQMSEGWSGKAPKPQHFKALLVGDGLIKTGISPLTCTSSPAINPAGQAPDFLAARLEPSRHYFRPQWRLLRPSLPSICGG